MTVSMSLAAMARNHRPTRASEPCIDLTPRVTADSQQPSNVDSPLAPSFSYRTPAGAAMPQLRASLTVTGHLPRRAASQGQGLSWMDKREVVGLASAYVP
jgi:hypothetical protein